LAVLPRGGRLFLPEVKAMSNIFRRSYTVPIPPDAELVTIDGVPSAKYRKRGSKPKTTPLTADGNRMHVQSPFWYGWVGGKAVKLFTDAVSSQQRLAELIRKNERRESGASDPFEEHRRRPLLEHLDDWAENLRNRGCRQSHVRATTGCVRRILLACNFQRMGDISASQLERYLASLRTGPARTVLDRTKDAYTKAEVAAVLGIDRSAVTALVRRHRVEASGNGKARRYPRATVETLREKRDRGIAIKTSNLYLSGMKAFCNFLVDDDRMAANPLAHVEGQDPQLDRRHDRRLLDKGELGRLIAAAAKSTVDFRGLRGRDRAMLYRVACTSGLRASELSALCPKDFDLDAPIVSLAAIYTKNKKPVVQPLTADVAEMLEEYLAGRAAGKQIWSGTWFQRAADMLRIDLEAADIPYIIQGPDGPLYADFHCLRHSFIGLLDRSGATLKEAMQLARHSDPKLTMRIYGKARMNDLAGAIDRLPNLGEKAEPAQDKTKRLG
jgi:integrase